MSQHQMNFEENRRDNGPSYSAGYTDMSHYDSSSGWSSGQKLSAFDFDRGPSSNQRLALAIVSIVFLMIMSIIMLAVAFIANSRASVVPR